MTILINIDSLPYVFRIGSIIKTSKGRLTRRRLGYLIGKLLDEKKLLKIGNGLYSKGGNVFYIACYVYKGYIGLSSALYLHGLKTEVEGTVYVCTSSPRKGMRIMDSMLVPVNMSGLQYGTTELAMEEKRVMVSTYPKTVFDMLAKPRYANYFDMYRALNERHMEKEEWDELLYYAKSSSTTQIRRIGYAMEGIAPGRFTDELLKLSGRKPGASFFFRHKAVNYSMKWKLFDDLSVRRWLNAV
ncbi:MAG: hypothetical protein KGI00_03270 [Candidatus Micrarchaeota archaeon]|nr:hypothetical protein [Planctomycetota bacterium]MDE1849725.1 hypothetical protein [Candidatus Micrarchaeota archaeon]